ncbi:MAG: sigma-70 family RNA polymerase sigma factor, partial [Chloroflexi bacterium]|nr:sigma-70 family RNA polymerase sigma factor [Chloroflexota bacterium]
EDAAQEAIALIYQNLRTCSQPAAFLKFAIYQLLTAFHRIAPQRGGTTEAVSSLEEELLVQDTEKDLVAELQAEAPDLEHSYEARERAAGLLRWLRGVIDANPRARNQILAVTMKYLEGREDAEIAAALGTTAANVYVLRSRGLEKLRHAYRNSFHREKDSSEWIEHQ